MGRVVPLNRGRRGGKNSGHHLDYSLLNKYADMMVIQEGIFEELYRMTEEFLNHLGIPANLFILDEESARRYLASSLLAEKEFTDELSICFVATLRGTQYRTYARADTEGEDIYYSINLFKKIGKEWFVYDGPGMWVRGPGEGFW